MNMCAKQWLFDIAITIVMHWTQNNEVDKDFWQKDWVSST
jgi:hypothetical protein